MSDEEPQKSVKDAIAEVNLAFKDGDKLIVDEHQEYTTVIGEFKGNKVLNIFKGENRVMGFGLKKAQAVLASMEAIRKFVEEES